MRIITFECEDKSKEGNMVDSIEEHIAKIDTEGVVVVNYLKAEYE